MISKNLNGYSKSNLFQKNYKFVIEISKLFVDYNIIICVSFQLPIINQQWNN